MTTPRQPTTHAEAGGPATSTRTPPALALHRRCGFRVVGVRAGLGQLHGRWRDVLLLERRSARVGQRSATRWWAS
jgi:hypothetical protein